MKYETNSSFDLRDQIVGFEIFPPFTCKIGNTAPSLAGLINEFINQPAERGPVSDSPSPITVAAITSGLSKTAPAACDNEYPNSPPS